MTRLSDEDVQRLRERHAEGAKQIDLAEEFGVCEATVSLIVRGLRRRAAGGPIKTYQTTYFRRP